MALGDPWDGTGPESDERPESIYSARELIVLALPGVTFNADGSASLPAFPTKDDCERFVRMLTDAYHGRDPMADGSLWFDVGGAEVPEWFERLEPGELGAPFDSNGRPWDFMTPSGEEWSPWAQTWKEPADALIDLACQVLGGWLAGTVVGEWKASTRYPEGWGTYGGFRSILDRCFDRLHINHVEVTGLVVRHGAWFDRDGGPHMPGTLGIVRARDGDAFSTMLAHAARQLDDIPSEDDSFSGYYLPELLVLARGWVPPDDCFAFPLQWGEAQIWGLWAPEDGGPVDATIVYDETGATIEGAEMLMDEGVATEDYRETLEDTDLDWVILGPVSGRGFTDLEGYLPPVTRAAEKMGLVWNPDWPGKYRASATTRRDAVLDVTAALPGRMFLAAWGELYPAAKIYESSASSAPGLPSRSIGWTGDWDPPISEWDIPEFSDTLLQLMLAVEDMDEQSNESSKYAEDGEGLEILEDFFGIPGATFAVIIDALDQATNAAPMIWIGLQAGETADVFGEFEPGTLDADVDYRDVLPSWHSEAELWVAWANAAGPAADVARLLDVSAAILRQVFVVDHLFDPVLRQAQLGNPPDGTSDADLDAWKAHYNEFSKGVRGVLEDMIGAELFALPGLAPVALSDIRPGDGSFPSAGEILSLAVRQVLSDVWVEFMADRGVEREVLYALLPWMADESQRGHIDDAFGQVVDVDLPARLAAGAGLYLERWDGRFPLRECLAPTGAGLPIVVFLDYVASGATGSVSSVATETWQVLTWWVDARGANAHGLIEGMEPTLPREDARESTTEPDEPDSKVGPPGPADWLEA